MRSIVHASRYFSLVNFITKRTFSSINNISARKFINAELSGNKIVVFGKSFCPFCKMVKASLNNVQAVYKNFDLDLRDDLDGEAILDRLLDMTGGRTVPRVFIDGTFIGGGTEIRDLEQSGQLAKMVA